MQEQNAKAKNLHHKIGVVIPAHNEAATIAECLKALQIAIVNLPDGIEVNPVVVLDSCVDSTLEIVKSFEVDYLTCNYLCVGKVRDKGIEHAIGHGATWVACTDADSTVAADWLVQQLSHIVSEPVDMICGVVSIQDWDHLTTKTKNDYLAHYQDVMGHQHIHGANLSFSSEAYLTVGGFDSLVCHEDVDLVKKFESYRYHIVWSNKVRVTTSSRLKARTSEGFAAFLRNLQQDNL